MAANKAKRKSVRTHKFTPKKVHFSGEIWQSLKIDGLIILLIFPDEYTLLNRAEYQSNLYAFDPYGRLIWRIEPASPCDNRHFYQTIRKFDEEILVVGHGIEGCFKVSLGTGRIEPWTGDSRIDHDYLWKKNRALTQFHLHLQSYEFKPKEITFLGNILETLEIDGLTVFLIDRSQYLPRDPNEFGRNVYAYDPYGRLVWRIAQLFEGDNPRHSNTEMWKYDEETLVCSNSFGYDYKVELGTGRVEIWTENGSPPGRPW